MTILSLKEFHGEVPRLPAHLLPEGFAQDAQNCDFAHGELRPLKGVGSAISMANSVKSIYTEDGTKFFTWVEDVDAVKSPTIDDVHGRVYYTTPTDFRVTKSSFMQTNGGNPSQSWRVGVPAPAAAPVFTLYDKPAIPKGVTLKCKHWFETSDGKRYQESDITGTMVTLQVGRRYQVTGPARTEESTTTTATEITTTLLYDKNGKIVAYTDANGQYQQVYGGYDEAGGLVALFDVAGNQLAIDVTAINSTTGQITGSTTTTAGTPEGSKRCYMLTGHDTAGAEVFRLYSTHGEVVHADATSYIPGGAALDHAGGANLDGTTTTILSISYGIRETRAYVFRLVNSFGEVGPPSAPTTVEFDWMNRIRLQLNTSIAADYVPIVKAEIYRTRTGMDGETQFYYVEAVSVSGGSTTYEENVGAGLTLGETLDTLDHDPPDPMLVGLMALPNGYMAAWKGKSLRFSEAYKPYAWKTENEIPFTHDIIGAAVQGNSIVVTTRAGAWLVTGVSPETMTPQRLPVEQAGVSKRSICNAGGRVVYASNDGLVVVDGPAAGLAESQRLFTREDWRNRYSAQFANLILAAHDGLLVGLMPGADGFVIRLDEVSGEFCKCTIRGSAAFVLPLTDGMYVASGSSVQQFAAGASLAYAWQSKDAILPSPQNFGACQVFASGTATLKVYADGALKHTESIDGDKLFRLPSGFRAWRWSVRLEGTAVVKAVCLGTTYSDLGDV